MARLKKSDFKPARERIDALPEERRKRIEQGAARILQSQPSAQPRKAIGATRAGVAERSGIQQPPAGQTTTPKRSG